MDDELLTTGQVAQLLGLSRQGVVDMCERGALPFVRVGTHRRIRHSAIEPTRRLTREQERTLWLHRAVCGRLALDGPGVLAKARSNLAVMARAHAGSSAEHWVARWTEVLDGSRDALADLLVSRSAGAVELRQNSPFAGVLSEAERRAVLAGFYERWGRTHAA